MSNRFENAIHIANGACNPSGIAIAFVEACKEAREQGADTNTLRNDPALRLIAHQLAFLMNVRDLDESLTAYGDALNLCRLKAAQAA